MFVSNCFAFTDISVDLRQNRDTFVLALKDKTDHAIHLTLSYLQVRLLAEGMFTMLGKAQVKELMESEDGHLAGSMSVNIALQEAINNEKGENAICQQPNSSVQMETLSLSKIA